MADSLLGDYLRARRAQVLPEVLGFSVHGRRRVPGLRREEVATVAGLSADYYTRLEQGRERHPSVQVLEALSIALRLDKDARLHLFRVAGVIASPTNATSAEQVSPQLLDLMNRWPDQPAIVLGKAYDVLAANAMAQAFFVAFRHDPNMMSQVFLDQGARQFYPDWEEVAAATVAGFRVQHSLWPGDERIAQVLATLLEHSEEFARLWEWHDARGKRMDSKRFHHREVGDVTLQMHVFDVKGSPGQELIVYHAQAGSPSADALTLLGALVAAHSG